jgi:hypothetical protein
MIQRCTDGCIICGTYVSYMGVLHVIQIAVYHTWLMCCIRGFAPECAIYTTPLAWVGQGEGGHGGRCIPRTHLEVSLRKIAPHAFV